MMILLWLVGLATGYQITGCYRYENLAYNAPCYQCKPGFQLDWDGRKCRECKDGLKEVNGRCVTDYDYAPEQVDIVVEEQESPLMLASPTSPPQEQASSSETIMEFLFFATPIEQTPIEQDRCLQPDEQMGCKKCIEGFYPGFDNLCQPIPTDPKQNCQIFFQLQQVCSVCSAYFKKGPHGTCWQTSISKKQKQKEQMEIKNKIEDLTSFLPLLDDFKQGIASSDHNSFSPSSQLPEHQEIKEVERKVSAQENFSEEYSEQIHSFIPIPTLRDIKKASMPEKCIQFVNDQCKKCQNGYQISSQFLCQSEENDQKTSIPPKQELIYGVDESLLQSLFKQIFQLSEKTKETEQDSDKSTQRFTISSKQSNIQQIDKDYGESEKILKEVGNLRKDEQADDISSFIPSKLPLQPKSIENQMDQKPQKKEQELPFQDKNLTQKIEQKEGNQYSFSPLSYLDNQSKGSQVDFQNQQKGEDFEEEGKKLKDEQEVEFIDLHCQKIDEEKKNCLQCNFFYYFDLQKEKCEAVDPVCKTYEQRSKGSKCKSCYWGYIPSGQTCVFDENF